MPGAFWVALLTAATSPDDVMVEQARGVLERLVSAPAGPSGALAEETVGFLRKHGVRAEAHPAHGGHAHVVARAGPLQGAPTIFHAPLDHPPCAQELPTSAMPGGVVGCGTRERAHAAALVVSFIRLASSGAVKRPMVLVLTGAGPGTAHLLEVLPDLAQEGATVFFPAGFRDGPAAAVVTGAQPEVTFTLVAHGDPASAPTPTARLFGALARVASHIFPSALPELPTPGPSASWAALRRTTCAVESVTPQELRPRAFVRCRVAGGEAASSLAWKMVDVVADPKIVVERVVPPAPAPPVPLSQLEIRTLHAAGIMPAEVQQPLPAWVQPWVARGVVLRGVQPFPGSDAGASERVEPRDLAAGVTAWWLIVRGLAGAGP